MSASRPEPFIWHCRDARLELGHHTRVMGILNLTPDSFYEGSRLSSVDQAVDRAGRMIAEGADLIDIGGESSRPGAEPVSVDEELSRVIPVVEALAAATSTLISVDTTKSAVARAALAAGAHIINDISAGRADPAIVDVVREFEAGMVLMHMQGTPRTMQDQPVYDDVVAEVGAFLAQQTAAAQAAGLDRRSLVWDPGIGFGKDFNHNWTLVRQLSKLTTSGYPLLVGLSRKRFLGSLCNRPVTDRLAASLAAAVLAIQSGAAIIRVHDVKESCDAARVADRIRLDSINDGD